MSEHYHFIGIGGIGMSGLARLLLHKKKCVSGSDIAFNYTIEGLAKAGAIIHKGQAAENISAKMTVVYSSDIKPDNPEYQTAIQLQCALLHRSDLLVSLIGQYRSLAVAGTHGKTTTSSLLATVLVEAGLDPSFAVGGMLPEFQSNSRFGEGDLFAFEADESDRTFLKYHPFGAIVTNIDNDHLNNYEGSESLLIESFNTFMSQVASPDHLIWCGDDLHLRRLNRPGQRYGFSPDCEWVISNVRQDGFQVVFDLKGKEKKYSDIVLNLIGTHNALNAAAVFALSITLGIPEGAIRQTFKSFKGVLRRCEKKGEINNILFVDDYAHHPTEISATLKGLRLAVPNKRLIAVFQPHRYSRTKDCLGQYGNIFDAADELIVTDIYGAGETPIAGLSHELIIQEIQQSSPLSCQYVSRPALSHKLSEMIRPDDVIITLGAGDVTKVAGETLALLSRLPGY
ncbi:UDP-N-acetylmuramate--L-alanine ligase [Candidatus Protochlamydia phocaeensis]|uniref:UDP-N-acetylmuramate--L-alanine ligase n=1 Tax=Candidatus Protochlamydia phocaeensis TaxID=1414722 RepID=UPI0008384326|nr:UDP-N-acetylmuramate--L-alanine ligase [Candidatus Protochlamydia phocaeensis]